MQLIDNERNYGRIAFEFVQNCNAIKYPINEIARFNGINEQASIHESLPYISSKVEERIWAFANGNADYLPEE